MRSFGSKCSSKCFVWVLWRDPQPPTPPHWCQPSSPHLRSLATPSTHARAKAPGSPHPTDGGARVPVQGFLRHDGCHKGTAISEQHSRRSGGHDRPRPYLRGLSPPPQLVPTEPILPAQGTGRPSVRPCLGSHHMVVEWPPRAPARSEATERLEINPTRMPRRSWGR